MKEKSARGHRICFELLSISKLTVFYRLGASPLANEAIAREPCGCKCPGDVSAAASTTAAEVGATLWVLVGDTYGCRLAQDFLFKLHSVAD